MVGGYLLGGELACSVGLFFFFQAEDGIRDDLVTGVQTCALPISFICVLINNPFTSFTYTLHKEKIRDR